MKQGDVPLIYEGSGVFHAASTYWERQSDERFKKGSAYVCRFKEHRTHAEHARYFASIGEAWGNLPEDVAAHFQSGPHAVLYREE